MKTREREILRKLRAAKAEVHELRRMVERRRDPTPVPAPTTVLRTR